MNDTPLEAPETEITAADDPVRLFSAWFEEARKREPNDAEAMSLATVDDKGMPDVRMVLLKGVDQTGFVFYTNFESAKGRELLALSAFVARQSKGRLLPRELQRAGHGCPARAARVGKGEAGRREALRAR